MSGQDEREALEHRYNVTRADGRSAPGEKHNGCRYFVLDLTHDPKANALLDAYFDRPTPHVVTTVEELRALDPEKMPFYAGGPHGFAYATVNVKTCDDRILAHRLPATVLTPAPAPADREALIEQDRLDISAVVHQGYYMPEVFATVESIVARHRPDAPTTSGDEREALTDIIEQAFFETGTALEAAAVAQDRILAAGFRRPTPPGEATSVVTTVEECGARWVSPKSGESVCAIRWGHGGPHVEPTMGLRWHESGRRSDPIGEFYPPTPAPAPADREALVERVAHAIAETDYVPSDGGSAWEAAPDLHDSWRVMARAALDAIEGVRHA